MTRNLLDQPTLLLLFLVVIPFVLFVSALVDILRRPGIDGVTRLTWVIVVLVLPLVGAVLWFVLRARFGTAPASSG
ncbi:PLDc N-terminal domain-containing protein [Aquipuribacter sp. MA13-6]|uniref:PLDc N-terminal domain-containing protein n=1 Tax=unclassified Aquipuribacter TaxID=2635084 RepID=UPI003EEA4EF2